MRSVLSKVLPLTASYLSPLSRFVSWPRHLRKLPVTLYLGFFTGCPVSSMVQLTCLGVALIWQLKGKIIEIPNSYNLALLLGLHVYHAIIY